MLSVAIIAFVVMELANVCILYFAPDCKLGNGVAVFDEWEKTKKDENEHLFAKYMVNWVAGVKLIFIVLLVAIVCVGNEHTKIWAVIAMILSIATYYWRLDKIITKLDENGHITPSGYSKILRLMITIFVFMFIVALIAHFIETGVLFKGLVV